jgi:hypothetical protein
MKKTILAGLSVGWALAVSAGPDMKPGKMPDATALPPGTVPADQSRGVSVDMRNANEERITPLALAVGAWGIPFSRGWNVYGIRANVCFPGWHAEHNNIYGIDGGVSGEINGDAAGICVNVFDNVCRDFGGIQIGGVYNRIAGNAPIALQASLGHNRANTMNGMQIGCWNVANRLRGVQIGLLVNHAESGAGLQIGLWNQCGTQGSPILGAVF